MNISISGNLNFKKKKCLSQTVKMDCVTDREVRVLLQFEEPKFKYYGHLSFIIQGFQRPEKVFP